MLGELISNGFLDESENIMRSQCACRNVYVYVHGMLKTYDNNNHCHDVPEETLGVSCFQPITSIIFFPRLDFHISFRRCSMWQAAPRGGQRLNLEKDIGNFNVPGPQQMMSEERGVNGFVILSLLRNIFLICVLWLGNVV